MRTIAEPFVLKRCFKLKQKALSHLKQIMTKDSSYEELENQINKLIEKDYKYFGSDKADFMN